MRSQTITSTVLLSLASAAAVLAAPVSNNSAVNVDQVCPLWKCPPLPPVEESKEKRNELVTRDEDAVPGYPFNCVNDECIPPKEEPVKRHEDIECIPPADGDVCDGEGCIRCPFEKEKEKREEDYHPCSVVCDAQGHCHLEGDGCTLTRKEKRFGIEHPPTCMGDWCAPAPPLSQEVKEKEKRWCIPSCVGEHCACDE